MTAEASRAFLIMDNIGHHLNKYSEDYQYIGERTNGSSVSVSNDLDVDGHTDLDNVSVSGVSTFSNNAHVGTGITFETNGQATYTGIVTAQKFVGDGSSLTGISGSGGVTVQDEGSALSTQASTLNFVGTGVVAVVRSRSC